MLLKSVTRGKKKIPKIILKTQLHEYNSTLKKTGGEKKERKSLEIPPPRNGGGTSVYQNSSLSTTGRGGKGNENFAVGLTLLTERENTAKETWRRVGGRGRGLVGEGVTTRKGSGTRAEEGGRGGG